MRLPQGSPLVWTTAIVLAAALFLGGGTRQGFIGDVVVQGLAILLLMMGLWASATGERRTRSDLIVPLIVIAVFVGAAALQLVPLPRSVVVSWSGLDRWAALADEPVFGALSRYPTATWAALISVLPAIAVFWAVALLPASDRHRLTALVLILGGASVVLGLLQVAQGPKSALRLFEVTNPTEAVGFFANRNHFAALLYTTLLLAAPVLMATVRHVSRRGAANTTAIVGAAAACALILALIAGVAMARSRAGLVLAMAAILALAALTYVSLAPARTDQEGNRGWLTPRGVVVALIGFAVLFAAQFGLARLLTRFEADALEDLRFTLTARTLEAAWHTLPFGAGLGAFIPVYQFFEATDELLPSFANRAHNDLAELFLEMGVVGLGLIGLTIVWLVYRLWQAMRHPDPKLGRDDILLQRVAGLACLLLLAHSLVDYPLRTTAMAVVFAFCAGLLTRPPATGEHDMVWVDEPVRTPTPRARPVAPAPQTAAAQREWAGAMDWPAPNDPPAHETTRGGAPTNNQWAPRPTTGTSAPPHRTGPTGDDWLTDMEWPASWQDVKSDSS